jgi:hypothetical protein
MRITVTAQLYNVTKPEALPPCRGNRLCDGAQKILGRCSGPASLISMAEKPIAESPERWTTGRLGSAAAMAWPSPTPIVP